MAKPDSEVLGRLRREMLRELDGGDCQDRGFVAVDHGVPEAPVILGETFAYTRSEALDCLVGLVAVNARAGNSWAARFPLEGTRDAQLRWLRRNGYKVVAATIRLED